MAGFADQVRAWAERSKDKMLLVLHGVAVESGARVIQRTPVRTGHLVSNWRASVGTVSFNLSYDPASEDPQKAATFEALKVLIRQSRLGDTVYIVNATPYGPALENGTSRISPRPMVRPTVQEFPDIVREVVAEVAR